MLEELRVDQYFTMIYAEIDLDTGAVCLVQAGHPHPVILRKSGVIDHLGNGGLPIGLIEGAEYQRTEATLNPGDRLILLSDGVTECPDPLGFELGDDGLDHMILSNQTLASTDLLDAVVRDLTQFHGSYNFPDDVSGIIFDFVEAPSA